MLEKILAVLTALVTAIEANTAALGASKTAPKTEKKTETKSEPAKVYPTEEEIVTACGPVLALGKPKADYIKTLAARFGVGKLRELKGTEKAIEAIAELKKYVEEQKAADESAV